MEEPSSPSSAPKMTWMMNLVTRKIVVEEVALLSFWFAMTLAKRPPCIAAQVTPPLVSPVRKISQRFIGFYNLTYLSLKELVTTETEENAMAAPAMAGFNMIPYSGYKIPAAMGIPITL